MITILSCVQSRECSGALPAVATEKPATDTGQSSAESAPSKDGADPSRSRRTVKSSELLGARNELDIEHNGELYRLRRTSSGKLILTK